MKRFLFWLIFLILFLFGFWLLLKTTSLPAPTEKKTEVQIEEPSKGMKKIVFREQKWLFLEQKINQPEKFLMLPNFEEKNASTELRKNNNCRFLVNGGFYDQQDRPLGWFFTQDKLWKKERRGNYD